MLYGLATSHDGHRWSVNVNAAHNVNARRRCCIVQCGRCWKSQVRWQLLIRCRSRSRKLTINLKNIVKQMKNTQLCTKISKNLFYLGILVNDLLSHRKCKVKKLNSESNSQKYDRNRINKNRIKLTFRAPGGMAPICEI